MASMSEKRKHVGELFRMKREEMHLTLKEVENATSIRMLYLQAIEEGRLPQLLSGVYAQGFMRQYSSFLGLDADKLAKEFPDAFRFPQEKQTFAYGIGTLEMRNQHPVGGRWMPNALWGAAFVALLIGAWYFARFTGLF